MHSKAKVRHFLDENVTGPSTDSGKPFLYKIHSYDKVII